LSPQVRTLDHNSVELLKVDTGLLVIEHDGQVPK
jgi:hypothetical protein